MDIKWRYRDKMYLRITEKGDIGILIFLQKKWSFLVFPGKCNMDRYVDAHCL